MHAHHTSQACIRRCMTCHVIPCHAIPSPPLTSFIHPRLSHSLILCRLLSLPLVSRLHDMTCNRVTSHQYPITGHPIPSRHIPCVHPMRPSHAYRFDVYHRINVPRKRAYPQTSVAYTHDRIVSMLVRRDGIDWIHVVLLLWRDERRRRGRWARRVEQGHRANELHREGAIRAREITHA